MKNLQIMEVNRDDVYKVIKENIHSCVTKKIELDDFKYHHNLSSKNVPTVLQHGLLSKKNQVERLENRKLTQNELFLFSDDSHVNGIDYISVSNMQDDFSMMSENEIYYNAYFTNNPDIIVSKEIKAHRSAITYFNEFIIEGEIPVSMFKCINVRILKFIESKLSKNNSVLNEEEIQKILEYYRDIRNIAIIMEKNNMNIPLKEASYITCVEEENTKSLTLDLIKVKKLPKIKIK